MSSTHHSRGKTSRDEAAMAEDADRRHVRSPPAGSGAPDRPVREQLAVVAGVGAYDFRPLANAAADARVLGALLQQDFGFQLLPSGTALIDGDADLATLEGAILASLDQGNADSRWLFYFAGHGEVVEEKGFLLPADAREGDPTSYLALEWLVQQALASRCREILIVLDMCYAGRALMKPDVQPWIEPGESASRGTVQLLAAGGPQQVVLDGGGQGHSVFSRCLLEALEGWAGIHGDDGSVRFTPLREYLDVEVERRLEAIEMDSGQQQLLGITVRAGLKGSVKGDFRFQSRHPRLPPEIIEGIRAADSRVRRASLAALPAACEDWPEELPRRLGWNLPLAMRLALRGLPEGEIDGALTDEAPPSTEEDWRVRRQAARTLGELGEFGLEQEEAARNAASRAAEPLLHLALRDPDPAVRREAGKGLARALDEPGQLKTGDRLEKLRHGASRQLRRRLWRTRVALPVYRRQLAAALRGRAVLTRAGFAAGESWRWVVRHRWRRSLAISLVAIVLSLYLILGTSYYLSTDRFDNVVVRRGIPGFEALPWIGSAVVVTDHHAAELADRAAATEERLVGSWLLLEDSAFGWGRRLADRLGPAPAGLELWRLGDPEGALDRLRQGIAGGKGEPVRVAAYLAIQSPAMAGPAMELLLDALAADDATRQQALQALEILRQIRPEAVVSTLEALTSDLEDASRHELPVLLDAMGPRHRRSGPRRVGASPYDHSSRRSNRSPSRAPDGRDSAASAGRPPRALRGSPGRPRRPGAEVVPEPRRLPGAPRDPCSVPTPAARR
ncbi:MAG: caspase family protein [Thermoanaerobaculia bacterium]